MPPRAPEDFPWDERGVFVRAVKLSILAKASKAAWRHVVEGLGATLDESEGVDNWAAFFYALPDKITPDGHYLAASVHLMSDNPDEAHWALDWKAIPSSPPPPSSVRPRRGWCLNCRGSCG